VWVRNGLNGRTGQLRDALRESGRRYDGRRVTLRVTSLGVRAVMPGSRREPPNQRRFTALSDRQTCQRVPDPLQQ
jgi:hypothetical protein